MSLSNRALCLTHLPPSKPASRTGSPPDDIPKANPCHHVCHDSNNYSNNYTKTPSWRTEDTYEVSDHVLVAEGKPSSNTHTLYCPG